MEYLIFIGYLLLFSWLITRVKFFTRTGLSNSQLIIIFLLKIMAGILYGWIGLYYGGLAQMQDTWGYHNNSILEYELLKTNPGEYFTNLFQNPYGNSFSNFFDASDSYWNDLKGNIFIKFLSVINIFSFAHYYVNIIFYSFITLFGVIAVYHVMIDIFPNKKIPVLLSAFLVPSFLYWTSGIHKEGLIFTGVAFILYALYFGLKEKKFGLKRILCLLTGLFLLLVLRNFLLVIILPAILAWLLASRRPARSMGIFASIYIFFSLLFFNVRYINPKLDFPQAVVTKQKEFIRLPKGGSTIPIKQLEPTAISFLKNTPQALTLSAVRPYPSDVKHILSLAAAIEVALLLLLFLLFLFFKTPQNGSGTVLYFTLFFSFSVLLAIGFSVNNLGAIVRYRSVIIPLLVIPMVAKIDWQRINTLFFKNIKIKNYTI